MARARERNAVLCTVEISDNRALVYTHISFGATWHLKNHVARNVIFNVCFIEQHGRLNWQNGLQDDNDDDVEGAKEKARSSHSFQLEWFIHGI